MSDDLYCRLIVCTMNCGRGGGDDDLCSWRGGGEFSAVNFLDTTLKFVNTLLPDINLITFRHVFFFFLAVIPAGVNIAYMCTQVKTAVDTEQNKSLWVPCQNS